MPSSGIYPLPFGQHLENFAEQEVSVSKAGMDVSDLEELRKQYPGVSFIFIYHTTKEGRFKGVNTHAHEVDVIVEVGKGEAKATGRFNAGGAIIIKK